METYDSRTVASQIGIPYRTLMYWVETGLIQPHEYSGRRRTPVRFSDDDVREIGRLAELRKNLRGQSLRDVLSRLRAMGPKPLSQGDFLVLENRKGQRNVIRILQNNEAQQLMSDPRDDQLKLIPLTGDEVQESILAGRQHVLFSTLGNEAAQVTRQPKQEDKWGND